MNQQYINLITNLFSLSLVQLLYKFQVYPTECFHQKSAVGLTLWSLKQSILSEYVDKLIQQLQDLICILEGIEIQVKQDNKILTTCTINIVFNQENNEQFSQFDSDIQLKTLIYTLNQKLKTYKIDDKPKTFCVNFLTNGAETQNKAVQETLLQNWILIKESKKRETQLVNSLHMPNLDILVGLI
ncbi:unnamed protein product [Paramecium sonneborni]|uniref:HORMA domain-containing protein n=1 Tax=Paramecium sonneborni TaxID=65129 RepID=A0A8S1MIR9_9CILI|nr:unnamed protein product [Paramecium sonneborni]